MQRYYLERLFSDSDKLFPYRMFRILSGSVEPQRSFHIHLSVVMSYDVPAKAFGMGKFTWKTFS